MIRNISKRIVRSIRLWFSIRRNHKDAIKDATKSFAHVLSEHYSIHYTTEIFNPIKLTETPNTMAEIHGIRHGTVPTLERVGSYILVPSLLYKSRTYVVHVMHHTSLLEDHARVGTQRRLMLNAFMSIFHISNGSPSGRNGTYISSLKRVPCDSVLVAILGGRDMIVMDSRLDAYKIKKNIIEIKRNNNSDFEGSK